MGIKIKHFFTLVCLSVLFQYCTQEFDTQFEELSSADSTWLVDYDENGQADSLEIHAAGCSLSIQECLILAQTNFNSEFLWLVDSNENGIADSLESYIDSCTLTTEECIEAAKDSIRPVFSLETGTYVGSQLLEINNVTASGDIRFTLDDTKPTIQSQVYSSALLIDSTTTVQAALFINDVMVSNIHQLIITLTGISASPIFNPPPGDYSDTVKVGITAVDSGAIIRYTLDGSEPSDIDLGYSDSITVSKTLTIKAITYTEGLLPSSVTTGVYRLVVAEPEANVDAGIYDTTLNITLSSSTFNSTIRYTLNGDDPNALSTQYLSPIEILSTTRVKAKAFKTDWTDSPLLNRLYQIHTAGNVIAPVFDPSPGTYVESVSVSFSATPDDIQIYYTLDETVPGPQSSFANDSVPIIITSNTVIKAIAYNGTGDSSAVVTGTYLTKVDTPSISLPAGVYSGPQTITLTSNTEGAEMYFTLNGDEPDNSKTKYTAPFTIPSSVTLKVRAIKPGSIDSDIQHADYDIVVSGAVGTPNFYPSPGTYQGGGFSLIIGTSTPEAKIYYTTDGSDPDETDLEFTSPFPVLVSTIFKAKAFKEGLTPSAIREAVYTIQAEAPVFAPTGGLYYEPQIVTLSANPSGATIRYTLDGTDPSEDNGTIFVDPITISDSLILKAIAYQEGLETSELASATYFIQKEIIEPTVSLISPIGGETWLIGTSGRVSWTTEGDVNYLSLDYSLNNGANWSPIIDKTSAAEGFYEWLIPTNISPSQNSLVRATIFGTNTSSQSPETFTLASSASSEIWAYYPFSGNSKDASGNSRHATNSNATLAPDHKGNSSSAYSFNGFSSYMVVPSDLATEGDALGNEITVTLWLNAEGLNQLGTILNYTSFERGFLLERTIENQIRLAMPSQADMTFLAPINPGVWYFVAFRILETGICIFINENNQCKGFEGRHEQASNSLVIGARPAGTSLYIERFQGTLDEIKFFNRGLSKQEILDIYNLSGGALKVRR